MDTSFVVNGSGHIGLLAGQTGTGEGEFNAPFDVTVSPDGSTIAVSDSGNNRVQFFDASGSFSGAFGSTGTALGQFSGPKGLTYDSGGTLYVFDSGNNRIVQMEGQSAASATGTAGSDFGQLSGPLHLAFGEHGVYVADTGNGRVESFDSPKPGTSLAAAPAACRFALSSGLNSPAAVVGTGDLIEEKFYVADTGNNRVLLCSAPVGNPLLSWNDMKSAVVSGYLQTASTYFSADTQEKYAQAFLSIGAANLSSQLNDIGTLTEVYIHDDDAEYYFEQAINGQTLLFPVEFVRENGQWKVKEF